MTAPQLTREQKASRFRAIGDRLARMSQDWQLTPEGEAIVARLIETHPLDPVLTFDPNADRNDIDFVAAAPADIGFLLDLVRELGTELRALRPSPKKQPDYAAECAMKCADRNFQQWMSEVHGLDNAHDDIRVASRVRTMLAITSRKQLNTDPDAAARWRRMVEDFEHWNRKRTRR